MLKQKEVLLFVVVCMSLSQVVEPSKQVVEGMTLNFGKGLDECRKEMNLPDSVTADFIDFWKDDHVLTNRDTGCAIMCLAKKLELVSEGGLHHGNALDFAKQHGADATVAQEIVDVIHNCEKTLPALGLDDPCMIVLEWAKCYKMEIHKRNWAPSMDVLAGELLSEV